MPELLPSPGTPNLEREPQNSHDGLSRSDVLNVKKEVRIPESSPQLAWFIGVLCGSGYKGDSSIELSDQYPEFIETFCTVGENLFNIPILYTLKPDKKGYKDGHIAHFHRREAIRFLGNLNRHVWVDTLHQRHAWMYENEEYLWAFINGYFDSRGYIGNPEKSEHHVLLGTSELNSADELIRILKEVGITTVRYEWMSKKQHNGRLHGVYFDKRDDIELFSHHVVYSSVPRKEEVLSRYRNGEFAKIRPTSEDQERSLEHSTDLAWMLGILSGGGSVTNDGIEITSRYTDLVDTIQNIGERLLQLPGYLSINKNNSRTVRFNSMKLSRFLGNFKSDHWIQTLAEHHSWIYSREKYVWSFLRGYFDKRGDYNPQESALVFSTHSRIAANELSFLLAKVGVENVSIIPSREIIEGIKGISIDQPEDIQLIANNIRSCIPEKDEWLQLYRPQEE